MAGPRRTRLTSKVRAEMQRQERENAQRYKLFLENRTLETDKVSCRDGPEQMRLGRDLRLDAAEKTLARSKTIKNRPTKKKP